MNGHLFLPSLAYFPISHHVLWALTLSISIMTTLAHDTMARVKCNGFPLVSLLLFISFF